MRTLIGEQYKIHNALDFEELLKSSQCTLQVSIAHFELYSHFRQEYIRLHLPERVDEEYWIPVPGSHPEDGYQPCTPEEDARI